MSGDRIAVERVAAMTFFLSPGRLAAAALAAVAVASSAALVHAQQPSGPPNALQGFSQNRDKPIKINAESLEVRDKDKQATFSGNVRLIQGDVRLNSTSLVVFYDDQPPPAQPAPAPLKGGKPAATAQITPQQQNQQIKRVEAKGGVTVQQKDQTATGETGIFDMRANTVEMTGHVVITRGPNILTGDNLTVDMNSGDSKLTCGQTKAKCVVTGLFTPGSMKQEPPAAPSGPALRPRSSPAHHDGKDGLNAPARAANP
jgi:lipopolysaccharide export system protein LptA